MYDIQAYARRKLRVLAQKTGGKGYGREMLRLNLLNAQKLGIQKVLVTCNVNNPASERIIISNGGVFENIIKVNNETMKRYWITVDR